MFNFNCSFSIFLHSTSLNSIKTNHLLYWISTFLQSFFPSLCPLSIYWCVGLFLPRSKNLHFLLLNSMSFLSDHFSSLLQSPWMAEWPPGTSVTVPSFVVPANWLRLHSTPSSTSLMKMSSKTRPNIQAKATLPATGLQLDSVSLITSLWVQHLLFKQPQPDVGELPRREIWNTVLDLCLLAEKHKYLDFLTWFKNHIFC